MTKRHSDGRGGERRSSPCSSIMFSMASLIRLPREEPAGLPLVPGCQGERRFSGRGVGCGFAIWGPFGVRASDACSRSTRCEDGSQLSTCSSATATEAGSRGSTEHVLGLRFTGFLMVSSVRRGNQIAGFPCWLVLKSWMRWRPRIREPPVF